MDEAEGCCTERGEGLWVEDAEVIKVMERGDARDPAEDRHGEGVSPVERDDGRIKSKEEAGLHPEEDLLGVGVVKSYYIERQRGRIAGSLPIPPAPVLRRAHQLERGFGKTRGPLETGSTLLRKRSGDVVGWSGGDIGREEA